MPVESPKFLYSYRLNGDGRGTVRDFADEQARDPAGGGIWLHIDIAGAGLLALFRWKKWL